VAGRLGLPEILLGVRDAPGQQGCLAGERYRAAEQFDGAATGGAPRVSGSTRA